MLQNVQVSNRWNEFCFCQVECAIKVANDRFVIRENIINRTNLLFITIL